MKTMVRAALIPAFAMTIMLGRADDADAQRTFRDVKNRFFSIANWSLEGGAGYGNIGRLLLQDVGGRQRELNPGGRFTWGVGANVTIFERTLIRIGFARVTGDLAYDDDTGDGGNLLTEDDLGDISANILSLEAGRFFFDEDDRFSPYARAGFAVSWWGLDDESGEFFDDGDETRWGATGALGVQFRITRRVALRLEAETSRLRNPFTGHESFIAETGFTIDEPSTISVNAYRAMLSFNLGRPRPFERRDDR